MRIAQASCRVYDQATNSYSRRVFLTNPFRPNTDIIYVPSIFPAVNSFMGALKDLTREHGLAMSAAGR
eukprot:6206627-Pleurochrysis_carterae.AAC.2